MIGWRDEGDGARVLLGRTYTSNVFDCEENLSQGVVLGHRGELRGDCQALAAEGAAKKDGRDPCPHANLLPSPSQIDEWKKQTRAFHRDLEKHLYLLAADFLWLNLKDAWSDLAALVLPGKGLGKSQAKQEIALGKWLCKNSPVFSSYDIVKTYETMAPMLADSSDTVLSLDDLAVALLVAWYDGVRPYRYGLAASSKKTINELRAIRRENGHQDLTLMHLDIAAQDVNWWLETYFPDEEVISNCKLRLG